MKNHLWKKMLAAVLAAVLVFPTVCESVSVLATEAAQESESQVEAEDVEETPVEEEKGMSMAELGQIPEGIVIAGIEAGGMSGAELLEQVNDMIAEKAEVDLSISLAEEMAELTLADIGICWGNESEIAEAMDTVVSGNIIAQYKVSKDIEVGDLNTDLVYGFDLADAKAKMEEIINQFGLEPQNATATFNGEGFDLTEDIPGVHADLDQAMELLLAQLDGWDGDPIELEIPAEVMEAEITSEYYEGIGLISQFQTHYWSIGSSNRNVNVQTAANNVNGHWFAPGETISVLSMIGKVDAAHGFLPAGTYITGGTRDEYGGGICQIATTLYNCFLDLELELVYRNQHSMHVDYVPYSMDAMIHAESGQDCIFKNNTGHPLYIQMYTVGEELVTKFYGVDDRDPGRNVVYRSVTLEYGGYPEEIDNPDPEMKPGTVWYERGGHPFIRSQLWKDVYQDGELISSDCLHSDVYKSLPAIRWYGAAVDGNGVSYYIDNQGYAVSPEGTKHRLNPDGTFLDDPVKGQFWNGSNQETVEGFEGSESSSESGKDESGSQGSSESSTAAPTESSTAAPTESSTAAPSESSNEAASESSEEA